MTEEADEDDLQQIRASLEEQIEEHRTALLELGQLAPSADLQQVGRQRLDTAHCMSTQSPHRTMQLQMQNELQQAITETQATLTELLGQAPHAVPPTKEAQLEPGSCYRSMWLHIQSLSGINRPGTTLSCHLRAGFAVKMGSGWLPNCWHWRQTLPPCKFCAPARPTCCSP